MSAVTASSVSVNRMSVQDPDDKLMHWSVDSDRDYDTINRINDVGSIQVYLEAQAHITGDLGLPVKMRREGFTITLTDEVEFTAWLLRLGNARQNTLFAFIDRLCTRATVTGRVPQRLLRFDVYDNKHINADARFQEVKPELVEWLSRVLRAVGPDTRECYLQAEFDYLRQEIQTVLRNLFPGMEVFVGRNSVSIPLSELERLNMVMEVPRSNRV